MLRLLKKLPKSYHGEWFPLLYSFYSLFMNLMNHALKQVESGLAGADRLATNWALDDPEES